MAIQFVHPIDTSLLIRRNNLLQQSLRPADLPYSIDQEYPIILAPDGHQYSLCALDSTQVIGHINLWPRELICKKTHQRFSIALVGNVATDQNFRGQGIMKQLLQQTILTAQAQGISALLLWSDLLEFYQKFGFSSFGAEYRLTFTRDSMKAYDGFEANCRWEGPKSVTESDLRELLALRYATNFVVERAPDDFIKYLMIPDCYLVSFKNELGFSAYAVLGKGYDLVGVIHEWGGVNPETVLSLIRSVLDGTGWNQITLLAPHSLTPDWAQTLRSYCHSVESHPMALVRTLKDHEAVAAALAQTFIWGLDSI